MSKILFIDTTGSCAQIFISNHECCVAEMLLEATKEQSAFINQMIENVLFKAELRLKDIDAIAINNGPGSYTGLRVGLSTAKGMAFALNIPIMLFNKLVLIANEYNTNTEKIIALKAREKEYWYYDTLNKESRHVFFQELLDINLTSSQKFTIITDDIVLKPIGDVFLVENLEIRNRFAWIKEALNRYQNKKFDELAYSEPFYLKPVYVTTPKNNILHS